MITTVLCLIRPLCNMSFYYIQFFLILLIPYYAVGMFLVNHFFKLIQFIEDSIPVLFFDIHALIFQNKKKKM